VTATDAPRRDRLEAPHRRAPRSFSRLTERTAVIAYRATAGALSRTPEAPTRAVLGRLAEASYLLWPSKRRAADLNFARVLRTEPDDPRVRRLARRAYRTYARYLTELMRLPGRPIDEVYALLEADGIEAVASRWRASGRGIIVTIPHIGNNEAAAAGLAHLGLPISGLADDSSFPELLELLTRQREAWGVRTIYWKSMREIFGVLRRGEILVLPIDWGYRDDGVPVRLFGRWTTLPAGPATLAARAGVPILPVAVQRLPDRRYRLTHDELIEPASSGAPDIQQATQRLADTLERAISAAPEQWYSFKPMWPASLDEEAELGRRASRLQNGTPGAGSP
jgi:KDO2-lipid IV(A) lauroyltransferase